MGFQGCRSDLEPRPRIACERPKAVSPAGPNLVVLGSPGDVRRFTDGLASMQIVMNNPGIVREIVSSQSHPNVMYAETGGYIVYRSDDAGLT